MNGYFITGTDTEAGKTRVSLALMDYLKNKGNSVAGMKPIASGANWHKGALINDDAMLLQRNGSQEFSYNIINPFVYEMPVSPHIAAEVTSESIDFDRISECLSFLQAASDWVIVEGVGGWLVPLGNGLDISDLAKALKLPVIVVVAIRLGCINHARLTLKAIADSGVATAGWVANIMQPEMLEQQKNIQTISEYSEIPLLGVVPFSSDPDNEDFAQYLSL